MGSEDSLVQIVRQKYAEVARSSHGNDSPGVQSVAAAFGYSADELAALPAEANMGLSCGNPVATAHLRSGETVVDLGCGGGIDVLLAAGKVGPSGRAIGIDMTPEMVERARNSAAKFGNGTPPANVEFHLARIEQLPLSDNSVDCLISNCVINLAPDKSAVFREMFRVLKPGGRVALSDIALKQALPDDVASDLIAYVGCVAGALMIDEYSRMLREAGFADVQLVDTRNDLNAYALMGGAGCCMPAASDSALPAAANCCGGGDALLVTSFPTFLGRFNANDYAASVQVYALKPTRARATG